MKSNYPVIFHFFTVHCEIVASVSYIWLSMMHVKPAQESTDTVWCDWDACRLRWPSSQSSGNLCLCAVWIMNSVALWYRLLMRIACCMAVRHKTVHISTVLLWYCVPIAVHHSCVLCHVHCNVKCEGAILYPVTGLFLIGIYLKCGLCE